MNFLKGFFKLNRFRRILILGITTIATIIAIVLGSFFYTSRTVKKGLAYAGGTEYLVQIKSNNPSENIDSKLSTQIANSIYDRLNVLGTSGVNVETGDNGQGKTVRIQYPNLESQAEEEKIRNLIINKPHLVLTDIYGNNLFDEYGKFNNNLNVGQDPGKAFVSPETFAYQRTSNNGKPIGWKVKSQVPLASGQARSRINQSGNYEVEITLESENASIEWSKATSYISSLPQGKKTILTWLDLDNLIYQGKNNWPSIWNQSNGNIFNFVHVNNDPKAMLRDKTIRASSYLISQAGVSQNLTGRNFVISGGGFNRTNTQELAEKINFGTSNYTLDFLSITQISSFYGQNAFNKAMIAGIIVFALIALFLIANYGLLGVISTVSISLYMFLTLTLFNLMQGEYSPATIASLIIGVGMSVDANIITFEKLKSEIYQKSSLKKAFKLSNSQSFTTIFDANITTLIVAFVLFFFGTREVVGLSVMLIISIFFTLIIMLGFTRVLTSLLIGTDLFDKRKNLLGVFPKVDQTVQKQIEKVDYVKKSKYFSTGSLVVIAIAILIFIIMAVIANSIASGFVLSKEFSGGTDVIVVPEGNYVFENSDIEDIRKQLIAAGIKPDDISIVKTNGIITQIKASVDYTIKLNIINAIQNPNYEVIANSVSNQLASQLVQKALIAISIAILLVIGYTLIRFKWTYSISAIIALIHDALIVLSVFVIFRITISPIFIAGILSIMGYSINDTIVTFDQIRAKMKDVPRSKMNRDQIIKTANKAVKDTLKRSLLTSFTTFVAVIVLMSFGNATRINFNIAMLVGILVGTYSSIFIATYIWTKLENFSLKRQEARIKKDFWKTVGVEEQTFRKINDFKQ